MVKLTLHRNVVAVAKMTAPSDTWKPARFWDLFFRSFKKSWTEKMEAITIGQTEFGLELRVLKADAPDLLETVLDILVRYLG